MKTVSAAQMRSLDQRTIETFGTPGSELMERAGRGIARALKDLVSDLAAPKPFLLFLAGKGNNGGDAWVAARYLHQVGLACEVWLAGTAAELSGDALQAFERADAAQVPWRQLAREADWAVDAIDWPMADIVVDALLGTGAQGAPRGLTAAAINAMVKHQQESVVVAIDLPSGMHADSGAVEAPCVRADMTLTLAAVKQGLLNPAAWNYCGTVRVIPIGIPEEYVAALGLSGPEIIMGPSLPRRLADSHKGHYGRVACLGGSPGLAGAIGLAGEAALRSGSGLVSVFTVPQAVSFLAPRCPEVMVHGSLGEKMDLKPYDAVLCGPGLGRGPEQTQWVKHLVASASKPLVLDADALIALSDEPEILRTVDSCILSPHPGELAALLQTTVQVVQADREGAVRAAAEITGAVVILKGAGTLVSLADGTIALNLTGNPGMASGGSGDVLAGILVSLLGQGLPAWDAARSAVYLHGCAGDRAARRKGMSAMTAGDIIAALR